MRESVFQDYADAGTLVGGVARVSAGVMILQEEGRRLLISDPVGKYLPEVLGATVAVANDAGRP